MRSSGGIRCKGNQRGEKQKKSAEPGSRGEAMILRLNESDIYYKERKIRGSNIQNFNFFYKIINIF
jgi:hypothetical protein